MYRDSEDKDVEDICYEQEHVEIVKKSIQENFDKYFDGFIETCAGEALDNKSFHDLQKKLGIPISPNAATDLSQNYKMIIRESIEEFEKDRQDYIEIFDEELLEETLEDDAPSFKSKTLRNECPIIRKTLNNRSAKELDKYRASFSRADAEFLMIDINKSITQQNYFYPYELFAYYAFVTYELLRDKASDYSVYIDPDYRYVVVDSFFEYVAMQHDDEISFLKSQIKDGGMGFA